MNTSNVVVFIGILATSILGHLMPQYTRPDLYFGVTIDPAFRNTEAARRILRNYRIAVWCSAVVAATLMFELHPAVALTLFAIGTGGAQVASHRSALIHAVRRSTMVEVDLSAPRERIAGGLLSTLLPLVVLFGLGLWAVAHIDQLPSRLAVHWGFDGPNRWVTTSSWTISVLLMQYASVCLVLVASAWGVLHWSRRICVSGASAAAERQFRRRSVALILTVEYLIVVPPIFSLLQAPALAVQVWSVAVAIVVFAFVVSLMRAGQGGARFTTPSGPPIGDRTPDTRWIGGFIYFNPTDPALLVETRTGIGWTLNFGNPRSWVPLVAVAVIAVIGPLLVQKVSHSAIPMSLRGEDSGAPLKSGPASAGTEDSLRRYILSLEHGRPNYEEMSPQLAASVKRQLPKIIALIDELGELKTLTYEGSDSDGSDVYVSAFTRGELQWHIGPLIDGKVTYRRVRPLS